jgi:hypothetical protein
LFYLRDPKHAPLCDFPAERSRRKQIPMAIFETRDEANILNQISEPGFTAVFVAKINGDAGLLGTPIGLPIGGAVTITSDGITRFDDTGFTPPGPGNSISDSLIVQVSDGVIYVDVPVALHFHVG